jgi:dTDP-glucose 4,6-dehydratase
MAKILITGASGFVGANLCNWFMVHTNHQLVGVDNMTTFEGLTNLEPVRRSKRFNFYLANTEDAHIMDRVFYVERPNYVIHAAGSSAENDLFGLDSVAAAASKYPVERMLALNYADDRGGSSARHFDETRQGVRPGFESAAVKWNQLYGTPLVVVNCCSLYGPRDAPNSMIPDTIYKMLNNEQIDFESYGVQTREWMYLRDAFLALCCLLNNGNPGHVYNITTGFQASDRDMAHKISKILGLDLSCERSHLEAYTPIPNVDRGRLVSMGTLGWEPSFEVDKSLEHTVCWYNANRWAFNQKLAEKNAR